MDLRVMDAEAPHRGAVATTVLLRFRDLRDGEGRPVHVARVLWYEDLGGPDAFANVAAELVAEAGKQTLR